MVRYKKFTLNIKLKKIVVVTLLLLTFFTGQLQVSAAINMTVQPDDTNADTQVKLNWDSVPGTLIYRIYRNVDEDGNPGWDLVDEGDMIATINVNDTLECTSYIDMGPLAPETDYNYTVKAYSDEEMQEDNLMDSGSQSVTTSSMLKPTDLSAKYDINSKQITIEWTNNSQVVTDNEINEVSGDYTGTVGSADPIFTFSDDAAIDAAIASSGSVQYTVTSTDDDGHTSAASDPVTVMPIAPPAITGAAITTGVCEVTLDTYQYRDNFELQRSKFSGTGWSDWETVSSQVLHDDDRNVDFALDIIEAAGIYRYRLGAKSSSNYEGYSAMTNTVSMPEAPAALSFSVSAADTIQISWTNDPYNRCDLRIERREEGSAEYQLIDTVTYDKDSYSDTFDYNQDTTYYYRIAAFDSDNNQAVSDVCSVSTSVPASPSALNLTVETEGRLTLNWADNSDNESNFIIEKKADSGSFAEIASVEADSASYTDNDVQTGHTYTYRVCARNTIGNSAYTNEVSSTTEVITAPGSLEVTPESSSTIRLSWAYPDSGSYSTVIERKVGGGGTWSVLTTVSSGVTQYTNTGLTANTQYFYRVKSVSGSYIHSRPYPDNDTGIDAYTMLGSLTLSGNASTSNRIYLSWSGNSGGTQFVIERKTASGSFTPVTTAPADTSSWYDTSVVPNAEYAYRIKAISQSSESEYSNEVLITNTYLVSPGNLAASVTQDMEIELTWTDNSNNETGFEIWRQVYGESSYKLYYTAGPNTTRFVDENVEGGSQYYYRVRAFTAANNTYSSFVSSTSVGVGVLNPPTELEYAIVSKNKIKLIWEDNSDNESGFKVERKVGSDGIWTTIATLAANSESYTNYWVDPDIKYYYRVKAYSYSYNNSSYSEEIQVSTAKPEAPSDLTGEALSSSQVDLEWKDNSYNEQGFKIERRLVGENQFRYVDRVDADVTSYSDRGLASNKLYIYRVKAYNQAGETYTRYSYARTKEAVNFSDLQNVSWAKEAVESLASRGVIKGNEDNRFRPDDTITRAEFTSLMMRAFDLNVTPVGSFADVNVGKWYYKELMIAKNLGIISGDDRNRFYPDSPITREDMAVILVKTLRVVNKPLRGHSNEVLEKYWDKNLISTYALSSMASLSGEGIMSGKSGSSIAPRDYATRAEAAKLIYSVIDR